ncbi:Spy/CpxP family protein refolding chaperone [Agaribacter marinus]|uniref:Uncharacterized protein n=1 Tax=Agaribacter marinus TaxID=1431249 RepID=A0AA37T208_9ALTE|nr:Spy/CpxP family protein refolding chaperone [Agaribacter marinus]GLR72329.1 hypothetical protein GCM10007852_32370 [Agaribacter marinus]
MKKILLAAAIGSILFASAGVYAQPSGKDEIISMFKQLDLSRSQKQEVRAIMQQLREDNSLYAADKSEIKLQIDSLFALDTWDSALANGIVDMQILSSTQTALNIATAKHQAFQVLTDEQKTELSEKTPSTNKQKSAQKKIAKLSRRLNLSETQDADLESLMEKQIADISAFESEINAHKLAKKALIQADEFDQDAWNNLQMNYASTRASIRLIKLETRFNFRKVLNEVQLEKLSKIENRKKHGQRRG